MSGPVGAPFYAADHVTIWHGNALALPLPDASVDLVVTSPPYFGLRSYTDGGEHYDGQVGSESTPGEFVDALVASTAEMVRVLKPSGSIWLNLGDKYAGGGNGAHGGHLRGRTVNQAFYSATDIAYNRRARMRGGIREKSLMGLPWRYAIRCIDDLSLILRAEVVWSKNGMPESVTDRVRRTHETWFHFTKEPRYFTGSADDAGEDGAMPGSVWHVPVQPLKVPAHLPQHFAAFPVEWPRRLIRGWCPEGGTVLDPFGGTGTTALAAKVLGRHAHHVDLSQDYCRLAQWRITDKGEIARAMQVERPPIDPHGMDSLFDLLEGAS